MVLRVCVDGCTGTKERRRAMTTAAAAATTKPTHTHITQRSAPAPGALARTLPASSTEPGARFNLLDKRPRRPSTKRTTWTGLSGRRNSAAGLSSDCDDDNERRRGEKRGAHSHTQPKYAVHFRSRRVRSSSARPACDFCMRHDFELSICHSSYVIICHSKEIYFHVR